ncbi:hypothetical protein GCM10023310_60580 [Paenibacillus vulneris]
MGIMDIMVTIAIMGIATAVRMTEAEIAEAAGMVEEAAEIKGSSAEFGISQDKGEDTYGRFAFSCRAV